MNITNLTRCAKESVIQSVTGYNTVCQFLGPEIKSYFEKHSEKWQHFSGWNFIDGGRNIKINYSYEDFWSNTEYYTEFDSITVIGRYS